MSEQRTYLELLLERYAAGEAVSRESIVENVVGKYRRFLREDKGACWDGPLAADLETLIETAEAHERLSERR